MNLGPGFLLAVLRDLALIYGPSFVLAIVAAVVARRRPGSTAAVVCWWLAVLVLAGTLVVGPTQRGGWVAALPAALVLALAALPAFRLREHFGRSRRADIGRFWRDRLIKK